MALSRQKNECVFCFRRLGMRKLIYSGDRQFGRGGATGVNRSVKDCGQIDGYGW